MSHAAVCRDWRDDERLTQDFYFEARCGELQISRFGQQGASLLQGLAGPTAARSAGASGSIDWRARFQALAADNICITKADVAAEGERALDLFLTKYKVLVVALEIVQRAMPATIKNRNKKRSTKDIRKAIFTKEATSVTVSAENSLVVDIADLPFQGAVPREMSLELWLLDKSKGKLALFSRHNELLRYFEGINIDLEVEHDHDWMPDLEEPFNYGFDAYERLCEWGGTPDEFPFRKASHSDDYLDLSLSHARFQFLLPDPPDLSSIPEGTGGEELFELEAAIYEVER